MARKSSTSLVLCILLCLSGLVPASVYAFQPGEYQKKSVMCSAIATTLVKRRVDIQLEYVYINPKAPTTILMVHGWPSLWSTWARQIEEFKDHYRLVIPDLRGFGNSSHPGDVKSSGTMSELVNDLVCILGDANVTSAVCMGHDWGSSVCYEAARRRPDIFVGVIGAVVPYIPAIGPFKSIAQLSEIFPTLRYQLFFDSKTEQAIEELNADVKRSVRATFRSVDSPPPPGFLKSAETFLGAWNKTDVIPPVPFFTPDEEGYFIEQFSLNGFNNTLHFYSEKNRKAGWNAAQKQGNHTITAPVLAVYPSQDPVANWVSAAKMLKSADYLPELTVEVLPGAHWVHLEKPKIFNRVVRKWMASKFPPVNGPLLRDEL
ncbi:Alpha/Beta hydrolase protein [Panaeolus papilionaceus]|nr:Alpha/Beta hydrolase protein [Panaeolus papilionaceus]